MRPPPAPWRTTPAGAIRLGRYKLLEFFGDHNELYDLQTDLGEQHDLLVKEPARAKALLEKLRAWRQRTNAPIPEQLNPEYVGAANSGVTGGGPRAHDVRGHFHYDTAPLLPPCIPLDDELAHEPHVAADHAGVLWLAELQFSPGRGQRVVVRRIAGADDGADDDADDDASQLTDSLQSRDHNTPSFASVFESDWGRYANPTLTLGSPRYRYLSYERESASGSWHLYVRTLSEEGVSPEIQVSETSTRNLHHSAAASPDGNVVLAWQGEQDNHFQIFVRSRHH